MFNESKYTRWYYSIIRSATLNKPNAGYVEKHHIIPKSLGGTNKKENIVSLTARQHFICHLLLTRMVEGQYKRSMAWALHRMAFSKSDLNDRRFTSAQFELARTRFANSIRGTNQTATTKKKIGDANRGWCSSEKMASLKKIHEANRGRPRSEASKEKQKLSIAASTKSKEHLQRLVSLHTGKKRSEETKRKMSEARQRNIKLACTKKLEALACTSLEECLPLEKKDRH